MVNDQVSVYKKSASPFYCESESQLEAGIQANQIKLQMPPNIPAILSSFYEKLKNFKQAAFASENILKTCLAILILNILIGY